MNGAAWDSCLGVLIPALVCFNVECRPGPGAYWEPLPTDLVLRRLRVPSLQL